MLLLSTVPVSIVSVYVELAPKASHEAPEDYDYPDGPLFPDCFY